MASKRGARRRSCESKVAHATFAIAAREAARLRWAHDGGTWTAYRCQWCGLYHVGRQRARDRQAMQARRTAAAG